MNFRSDNTAAAAPEIIAALTRVNEGAAAAYGDDHWSRQVEEAFTDIFEREVRVFAVSSGTAANAIAVASLTPPWGAVLCHREAHIERDECGAVEFFSGGAKLVLMDGAAAKITTTALEETLSGSARGIHAVAPAVLSISQTTERGAVYKPEEVAALTALAKRVGSAVHMDGARFANAVAATRAKPADLTWRAGIDLLSFGATKNGAIGAEAIVCFDPARAEEIERRRKRGGHLISKGRFVAGQLLAYVHDGLWLSLADRSNRLAKVLGEAAGAHLKAPVESNQVFLKLTPAALAKFRQAGVECYDWGAPGDGEVRLVVSWNQSEADIEAMRALLASL